jgi:hypothetical protein
MELNDVTSPQVRSLLLKQEILTASPTPVGRQSRGRPSKLTPELMDKLVLLVREGIPYALASRVCGIHRNTRLNWMRRGEKEADRIEKGGPPNDSEAVFLDFYCQADQADALAECEDIMYIRDAKPGWTAKAWLWARKDPETWGNKAQIEHTEESSQPTRAVTGIIDMCDGKVVGYTPVGTGVVTWRD